MGSLQLGVIMTPLIIRIGLISVLFFHHADSQYFWEEEMVVGEEEIQPYGVYQPKEDKDVVLSNGIVDISLTPEGYVSGISYKGSENLLNIRNRQDNRGYWDMTWNSTANGVSNDKLVGTSYKILVQNDEQTEISFTRTWRGGNSGLAPLNIDKRFVVLKDTPGFYTYTVLEHLAGWPAFTIQQARIVMKYQEKFHYMAVSDAMQRIMPTGNDRAMGQVLNFKEAVLLTNPSNPDLKGEVDDKYFYSMDNKDIKVHGWVGDDIGVWMITPSNEFRAGGPFKRSLTSHVGPTTLNMFTSTHYAGEPLAINVQSAENWKMVWGPVLIYVNSDPSAKDNPSKLWDDAKQRANKETDSWPYAFPLSQDFLKSSGRGTLRGRLLVNDRFQNTTVVPAAFADVGLARPGVPGSWQYENKGYQFWTLTDNAGNFVIKNVIPGTYSLYASVPGVIGDYRHESDIIITPGSVVEAKEVVFQPPRNGPTLWEIGVPDRTAAEFFIPDADPNYKAHKFPQPVEKFREYGLWARYTNLYANEDLVFTIGKSDYKRDWFFAQVNRDSGGRFQPTTWKIVFDLQNVRKQAKYTLQLAMAGALGAETQVRFNNPASRPHFSTGGIGRENIIARHGIHGIYRLYSIDIPGDLLVDGRNTLFLKQSRAHGPFGGVMYDYIRLEGPA